MSRKIINTQAGDGASFMFVQVGWVALAPIPAQVGIAEMRASVNWKVRIRNTGTWRRGDHT